MRRGAFALIAGGLVWAVAWFLAALAGDEAVLGLSSEGWGVVGALAIPLLMLGGWLLYVRLGGFAGGLGLAAIAVVELGLAVMLVGALADAATDAGSGLFAAGAFGCVAGLLLLGVAIVRTGAVRREASMPFAGGIAAFVLGALAIPVFGVGWLLWGYVLLAAARDPMRPPGERR